MATSRYSKANRKLNNFSSWTLNSQIRNAALSGQLNCKLRFLRDGERLDHVAGIEYGESSYWWIIAAASGIGWALQCTEGTELFIPVSVEEVFRLIEN
jgi:hypothetical protein